ncbi:hypothetical protein [Anaerosalibacter massiliensis]|uniref:hypothetical protein n=1 Tax=Anaerosalibacter massiliensis TaxID=1347392 RepID=UPI0005B27095|nr:hypothetical protein [Anaerosalibacter massiliensis]
MNEEKRKRLIEMGEKMQDTGSKMQETGDKMSALGCSMTLGITIPIILTIFLGPIGFVIGLILFVAMIAGAFNKNK